MSEIFNDFSCINLQERSNYKNKRKMMKKLLTLAIILGAVALIGGTGLVFASTDDAKPWESAVRFRGEDKVSASEMGIDKDEFLLQRDSEKEAHRALRMEQREERLLAAVERGCLSADEFEERMLQRKGRFGR